MNAAQTEGHVDILMYHSIGHGPGPLAIPPATFRMQLDTLAECGFRGVALRDYIAGLGERRDMRTRMTVLTFDDGYKDFADVVVPEITSRGWSCTVFVSSGLIGDPGGWDPDGRGKQPLLDWPQAEAIAKSDVEIGGHGVTHTDLTVLRPEDARREIAASRETIETRANCRVSSFAAPYGHTTPAIRAEISRQYECAVGTTLARADATSDRYNLPRIEMWYFRDPARWRAYLNGARGYFTVRQILRHGRVVAGLDRAQRHG